MSLLEMLQKRHSIRKYTDANISDQDLQTILQAGLLSASGRAARPWEFIVVRNKETLQKMSESRVGAAKMLANANAAIVVIADESKTDVWVERIVPLPCLTCTSLPLHSASEAVGSRDVSA